MKIVRLIRHAESVANAGLATTAPNSIPLTEKGLIQA
jgi:broad specificity phosphatase PhoE